MLRLPKKTNALSEILHNLALFPLWVVDLCRPWSDLVMATVASSSFGYGGTQEKKLAPSSVRQAARVAGRGPHHFRLRHLSSDPPEIPRHGEEFRLSLSKKDFKILMSVKVKGGKHSGQLEAEAVVLGLRRLARNLRVHNHRLLFLVDATAVLGALQRGRSSAPSLRAATRRAAGLILASGFRFRFGYLPSESNPADAPSRKQVQTGPRRRVRKPLRPSRFDKYCRRMSVAAKVDRNFDYRESLSGRVSSMSPF